MACGASAQSRPMPEAEGTPGQRSERASSLSHVLRPPRTPSLAAGGGGELMTSDGGLLVGFRDRVREEASGATGLDAEEEELGEDTNEGPAPGVGTKTSGPGTARAPGDVGPAAGHEPSVANAVQAGAVPKATGRATE